jgi:type II secretory pathway pseudopilin PulG
VSAVPNVAEPPAPAPKRRREWVLRATFEAVLILFGLLGAFALDRWQDARARTTRIESLLAAVRAELEMNLSEQDEAAAYNTEIADLLWDQGSRGVEFVPADSFKRGLVIRPQLTSAAWTTAQNDAVLSEIPVETVLLLADVYEMQRTYDDDVAALFNSMYATVLQPNSGIVRIDGIDQPLRVGAVLRDYASRGARLVRAYRTALEGLDVDPEP